MKEKVSTHQLYNRQELSHTLWQRERMLHSVEAFEDQYHTILIEFRRSNKFPTLEPKGRVGIIKRLIHRIGIK